MHCILERVVHIHIREILALTTASAISKLAILPAFLHIFRTVDPDQSDLTEKEVKQVTKIHKILTASIAPEDGMVQHVMELLKDKLIKGNNRKPLEFVCRDLGCFPSKRRIYKHDVADALVNWVGPYPPNICLHKLWEWGGCADGQMM